MEEKMFIVLIDNGSLEVKICSNLWMKDVQ